RRPRARVAAAGSGDGTNMAWPSDLSCRSGLLSHGSNGVLGNCDEGGTRSIAALHEYDRARLILIEDLGDSPEYVYLLIDPDANRPELSPTGKTNEVALWAYTPVLLLPESCGDGQPYTTVTPAQLRNFANELDTTALLAIDIRHPAGVRYPGT